MLTIDNIKQAVLKLADKYGIARVDLFGSYATGKAVATSDADFLVEFKSNPPSVFKVMGFKEELSNTLNSPVDVVTIPMARPEKLIIEKVVNIYERT